MKVVFVNGKYSGSLSYKNKWYMVTGCTSFEECTAKLIEEATKCSGS